KLQWKPDWAMRWVALGIDYEMAGKDLIDSVRLSGEICRALDGTPPEGFNYELFLDERGQKISKSKGNGLTIDEWLRYASPESLSLFMYREPKSAKRLYFDVIPRNVDDYQQLLEGFPRQDPKQQLANPVWHIHAGHPPAADMPVTFQLLLTLVSSSNAENAATLWGFIGRYRPGVTPQTHPKLDAMVGYAINYYRDFVAPTKKFREPTDGERAASYSPFLPICPRTGVVLYVPIVAHDVKAGTISYDDPETRERVTLPVTGGHCKLQWKPDWAMRWFALGVDYEMAGKDLIDSVKLSGKICSALGGMPPEGFNFELFLDDKGQKISKSKGNGLTIDEWLRYASPESLSLFMYREPKSAKRLYFDVIPRNVDDYQQFLDGFSRQDAKQQLANPVWHIHAGHPPAADMPVTFQLLLTLVSSSNAENAATLWGFIGRYRPGVTPQTHPKLDAMVGYAINYYRDFVAPTKKFREPTDTERVALQDLRDALSQLPANSSAEDIQNVVYEIGRREPFLDAVKKGKDGRPGVSLDWFNMLYQVLLGQEKGPRFGSFVAVYGLPNAVTMIDGALARSA
ncbi:MAG TPA: hypothetical protein VK620_06130, partial [Bradyrhizobium sp.]|nr:hypothetical protein [Bradyrhizobium sp.]